MAAAARNAPSIRVSPEPSRLNAMTVEPAPDRHAPSARPRGPPRRGAGAAGRPPPGTARGADRRSACRQVAANPSPARDTDRDRLRFATASARGHGSGSTRASRRREAQVRDEQDRPQVARRVEAESPRRRRRRPRRRSHRGARPRHCRGGPSISVARGRPLGRERRRRPGRARGGQPTVAAADDPRPRASGIWLRISIRQPTPSGSSPRARQAASRPPRTRCRDPPTARPRPRRRPPISRRLDGAASTSTRSTISRATARQSKPAPRFALVAGTSTATRRPSRSASQFVDHPCRLHRDERDRRPIGSTERLDDRRQRTSGPRPSQP